jgi:hypothetical protein
MLLGWSPASSLFVDEDASARQSASAVQTARLGRGSRNALYDPLWSLVRERPVHIAKGPYLQRVVSPGLRNAKTSLSQFIGAVLS